MTLAQSEERKKAGEPLLTLEGVGYHYPSQLDGKLLLSDVNLTLHRGDVVVVVRGRNGSGKTTLLKLLAGQIQPVTGSISKHADDVRVVYLNQHASDFVAPALTVREQLLVGMGDRVAPMARAAGATMSREVKDILARYGIGLPEKLDAFTSELSGGQRQVVALVTALASKADVLLLDEYTSFMDSETVAASHGLIQRIVNSQLVSVVIVDHSQGLLGELSNPVYYDLM